MQQHKIASKDEHFYRNNKVTFSSKNSGNLVAHLIDKIVT